jgi:F-type H+-transporting ATPase subunit delta
MAGHDTNHQSPAAITYARALLELANERQQAESVSREMSGLRDVMQANPTFRAFLSDPGISETEREQVLKRVFEGKLSPLMMNFLGVVNAKGRIRLLEEIADAYETLLWEQLGKIEVNITVAGRLDAAQLEQVRQRVSRALRKDAVVHQFVDPSIIGGMILRVQDQMIDASVKYQLESMRQQLLAARPK